MFGVLEPVLSRELLYSIFTHRMRYQDVSGVNWCRGHESEVNETKEMGDFERGPGKLPLFHLANFCP
jgi:hypothetical protein